MSADAVKKGKQKVKKGWPLKFASPLKDTEEGSDQPCEAMQWVHNRHSNNHKVGHYDGPLQEVIDSAQEALSVYLLMEEPFPMDEVTRNDQCDGTKSENPKRAIKWKKKIDGFFNAALEKNKDALELGTLFLDLMLCFAEGVCTKIRPPRSQLPSILQYVIHLTDAASFITQIW